MNGRPLMIAGLVLLAVFGVALWWFQTRAFYTDMPDVDVIDTGQGTLAVTGFQGVDATTSPIKMRACMKIDPADAANLPPAPYAEPLVAPTWFPCFDAKTLSRALEAGKAIAYSLGPGAFEGTERILAVTPDGAAFLWRQLDQEYANQ